MRILLVLGVMVVFFSLQLASASDACEQACWAGKNTQLDLLKQERAELALCRPNYLSCVLKTKDFTNCRETYIQCDKGGKKMVWEKTITATNVYNSCMTSCTTPTQPVELKPISLSSTCMKLFEIRYILNEKFSQEQIKKILSLNNCPAQDFFQTI
jgi:hypothetical protein